MEADGRPGLDGIRPVFSHAVAAFLRDDDPDVRHAATAAAVAYAEDPDLAEHRAELVPLAHRLLAESTVRSYRAPTIDRLRTEVQPNMLFVFAVRSG
ncbi:hypothetical protein [Streptomyces sp. SID3343]|uniref:hypothetical protein n=1 Tax=Streptomyces sp. SID3343 TaxID=2690260 RepID=UPI0013689E86|nr:hypothetical protein [Streptomyces sp. SID3343]MYW01167.1 hypothetical protein [Streptomyces sp. SID3343]MYW04153.1 hypothetical protein [Streptomyces sp. SID3343]